MKRSPLKRRTPLKPGGPIRRRTRLRQVSPKREVQNAEYERLKAEFLKANPLCKPCQDAAKTFGVQDIGHGSTMRLKVQPAVDVHHMGRRHGRWLCDTRFFLPVCRAHHDRIEQHGDWARERGYLLTPEQRRLLQP